jgi:ABC-2 type transport system permease protein
VTSLLRAELLKVRTTRLVVGLLAAVVGLAGIGVVGSILTAGDGGTPPLETAAGVRNVFGNAGVASILALIMGILVVTGELRHGTITQTFLLTPRRPLVVVAKLAAMVVVGLVFGAVAVAVTLAVALPWLAAKDVSVDVLSGDVATVLLAAVLSCALYGVIGVGVGAVIRNQVAAVVIALVWEFVLQGIVVALLPAVGKWLPQGAARALGQETLADGSLLPAWAGGLVLVAYAALFAAVGARLLVRRDIT